MQLLIIGGTYPHTSSRCPVRIREYTCHTCRLHSCSYVPQGCYLNKQRGTHRGCHGNHLCPLNNFYLKKKNPTIFLVRNPALLGNHLWYQKISTQKDKIKLVKKSLGPGWATCPSKGVWGQCKIKMGITGVKARVQAFQQFTDINYIWRTLKAVYCRLTT